MASQNQNQPTGGHTFNLEVPHTEGHQRKYSDTNPFLSMMNDGNNSQQQQQQPPLSSANTDNLIGLQSSSPVVQMNSLSIHERPPIPTPSSPSNIAPLTSTSTSPNPQRLQELAQRAPPLPPLPPREVRHELNLHIPDYQGEFVSSPVNNSQTQIATPTIQVIPPSAGSDTGNLSSTSIQLLSSTTALLPELTSESVDSVSSTTSSHQATQTSNINDNDRETDGSTTANRRTESTTTTANQNQGSISLIDADADDNDFFAHGTSSRVSVVSSESAASSSGTTADTPERNTGNQLLTPEQMRDEEAHFIASMPPSPNYSTVALPGELSIPNNKAIDPLTLNESHPDEPPPAYTEVSSEVAPLIMRPQFSQTGGNVSSGGSTPSVTSPSGPRQQQQPYRAPTGPPPTSQRYQSPYGPPPQRRIQAQPPPQIYRRPSGAPTQRVSSSSSYSSPNRPPPAQRHSSQYVSSSSIFPGNSSIHRIRQARANNLVVRDAEVLGARRNVLSSAYSRSPPPPPTPDRPVSITSDSDAPALPARRGA